MCSKYNSNSIFDERLYLPSTANPDVIKKLEKTINVYHSSAVKHIMNNQEIIDNYKKFILLASKLVKELGIENNSISLALVIGRLLDSGYFSNKFNFRFENPSREIPDFYGINVVNGKACCRNTSAFCKDIFLQLGLYNHWMPCVSETNLTVLDAVSTKANHVVNVINYDGKYYAYDVLNEVIFDFTSGIMLESLFYKKREVLFYKPSMDMIFGNASKKETLENIKKYNISSRQQAISHDEYQKIMYETSRNIRNNSNILHDFKNESKEYIKNIARKKIVR